MTRREFASRLEKFRRHEKRTNRIWGAVYFAILIGNWLWVTLDRTERSDEYWWTYLVLFFAFLFGSIPVASLLTKKLQEEYGIKCTLCNKRLDKNGAELAVTTGNCPHCSQKFLAD